MLQYTVVSVSVLVLGIGFSRGQYYWILDALLGIVLTLTLSLDLNVTDNSRDLRIGHLRLNRISNRIGHYDSNRIGHYVLLNTKWFVGIIIESGVQ